METKLPNFLIVVAPKSGTSSLHYYLKQHPEIYMSPVKEPRFITAQFIKFPLKGIRDDRLEKIIVKSFDEYKKLFSKVKNEKAIGEASIDNLYFYENAIKYIKKYLGEVRIIIILRNPIDRAFSAYQMFVRNLREPLSFEDALKAEQERKNNNWAFGWHYLSVGFYYKQVKAYLENFSQVKVYLFDDLKTDALGVAKDIFMFLKVNMSFAPDVSHIYNISGIPKNRFIHNFLFRPVRYLRKNSEMNRFFLFEKKFCYFLETLMVSNLKKQRMKPETREYLKNLYREDILKLQDLIKRDLSHWLR